MKKVAIVTITNSGMNFGNRLQNYALQEYISGLGASCETIESAKSIGHSLIFSKQRRFIKNIVKMDDRRMFFSRFNKRYIHFSKYIRYENLNESRFKDMYDVFITGSDQVWNPYFEFNSDFEFLTFADPIKRYSYAASFGIDEMPDHIKKSIGERLNGMQGISVREQKGAEIVQMLTGRTAEVHIDPTMLFDALQYKKIEEKPEGGLPQRYLLVYFLGNITDEYRKKIRKISEAMDLPILELSESKGTKYYGIGPEHFLYFIDHADFVCTDSFHGTVFSILFKKQFLTLQRKDNDASMNSRIDTLLNKFALQGRTMSIWEIGDQSINYDVVKNYLQKERGKAEGYLKKIICSDKEY